jgi:hypothetical protein
MNPTLLAVVAIVLAVVGGAIALALFAAKIAAKKIAHRAANFAAIAEQLNGTPEPGGYPSMRGMVKGRGFQLGAVPSGKSRFSLVRAEMLAGSSIRLELHPQTSTLAASMLADIRTGDAKFDAAMIVRSDRNAAALAILDAGVRSRLSELATHEIQFRLVVHERKALLEWQGDFASDDTSARAAAWVELLAAIVEKCEREAAE